MSFLARLLGNPLFWCLSLVAISLHYIWRNRSFYIISWKLPGPFSLPLIGNALNLIMDGGIPNAISMMTNNMETYGKHSRVIRIWACQELYVLVADASVAFQINKMPDKPDFYSFLGGLYIKGGLASDIDVDHWRWARKLMEPFFSLKNIKSWIQISHEESLHTAEYLQKYASSGESFLPLKTLRLFGMHVVGRAFFGSNLQSFSPKEKETALDNVEKMFEHFLHRVLVPITKNLLIYSLIGLRRKENILMKQLVRDIDKILEEKISRIKAGIDVSEDDYLTKLMREPELYMEVRQQAGTIMVGGIDTTSTEIFSILVMLALHPDVQNKLRKEIIDVLGDDVTQTPTYDNLMKLDYMERVLKEGMRMFPPVPVLAKKVATETKISTDIGEYTIPAGTTVLVLIHTIQNNPDYFDLPHVYDPDRWLPDKVAQRDPHCFLPFSSGPRRCMGGRFTMQEMRIFLATMLRQFEILPSDQCKTMRDVKFEMNGTTLTDGSRTSSGPRRCIGGKFVMQEMRIFLATMLRQFEILPSDQCKTMRDVKFEMNLTLKLKDNCQIRLRSRKPNLGI
ncbi:probable cytochrome P450 313a1 [Diaphorina citri]|uniref:Probable cytochrome P450 313a1 n=1 Tax=Diaphorina citri TaxID=121845 RepID=A0A3Q0IQ18_DIACI|nr:probable cytochrome P450 313a1 [Diaphorina citri]